VEGGRSVEEHPGEVVMEFSETFLVFPVHGVWSYPNPNPYPLKPVEPFNVVFRQFCGVWVEFLGHFAMIRFTFWVLW